MDITKLDSGGYVVLMSQVELDTIFVSMNGSPVEDITRWAEATQRGQVPHLLGRDADAWRNRVIELAQYLQEFRSPYAPEL